MRDGEAKIFNQLLKLHLDSRDENGAPENETEVKYLELENCEVQNEETSQSEINETVSHEEQLEDLDFILKILKNKDVDADKVYKSVMLHQQKYERAEAGTPQILDLNHL